MKNLILSFFLLGFSLLASTGRLMGQDVSLESSADASTSAINDVVTFTVIAYNDGHTNITGLTIMDAVPSGTTFSSANTPMGTTYDSATGVWDIGSAMNSTVDSMILTLSVTVVSEGVIFNLAEVVTMNEADSDSSPDNGSWVEDDLTTSCTTVPVSFCSAGGDTVTLTAVSGLVNYQWYLDTGAGPVAISGATNMTYDAVQVGTYTYTAEQSGSTCSLGQCCGTILTDVCGSVGNYVWNDTNQDGIQDGGEAGIDGVKVYLLDGLGTILDSTITAGGGLYNFGNLAAAQYQIKFDILAGYSVTAQNAGGDDTVDSDVDPNTGLTSLFTLSEGEDNPTLDFGLIPFSGSIGDFVWQDLDKDGIQDAGEPGIENVKVYLKDNTGAIIDSTLTDAAGSYSFNNLGPGDYSIQFVNPTGYGTVVQGAGGDSTLDSDGDATGQTATITLAIGESNTDVDMAYTLGSVGDYVWNDTNQDGIQDAGEVGFDGIKVYLLDGVGTVLDSTITTGGGAYLFPNLPAGNYQVKFDIQPSYFASPQDAGADDVDSDGDVVTGLTSVFALGNGEDNMTLDMGLYQTNGSIGNFVWLDENKNASQDGEEPGIENVKVYLKDNTGTIIDSTVTDASGFYSFNNLGAGDYSVQFILPMGYGAVPQGMGTTTDSDGDATGQTGTITLASGESNQDIDMGLTLGAIGDFVWFDTNQDGIQDAGEAGIDGVKVYLLDGAGVVLDSTITAGGGLYNFNHLPGGSYQIQVAIDAYSVSPQNIGDETKDSDGDAAGLIPTFVLGAGEDNPSFDMGLYLVGASIGNYVWQDLNHDGIQDAGEPGIENVKVYLKDNTGAIIDSTLTDASGMYSFGGLNPGDYSIQFVNPMGYGVSPQGAGGDAALDSDGDATGQTATITLAAGENNTDIDMAYTLGSIGNFVWNDTNQDGIQDGVEAGIDGVKVYLLDGAGMVLDSTITAGGGLYAFNNLPSGQYQIKFNTPAGYTISPQGAGFDPSMDSDADTFTGLTSVITLGAGEDNTSLDLGVYQGLGTIGDYVWNDTNNDGIQDAGEPGMNGVKIYLLDGIGNIIDSTFTNSNGGYAFTGLAAGDYQVQFVLPAGFTASPQTTGTADGSDGDMTGLTPVITLFAGENNANIDMGLNGACVCNDIVAVDTMTFQQSGSDILACIPLYFSDAQLYDIAVNGLAYNSGLSACAKDTFVYYSLFGAGGGTSGPYNLDVWNVNGNTYSGAFADINALADSMNLWDANGNWLVDGVVIKGGIWNPSIYGSMDVTTVSTGQPTHIEPNYASVMTGTEMTISGAPGVNTVVFTDTSNTCCTDTLIIVVEGDVMPASIGDYVWLDANGDGIQDSTESGMNGVTVELIDSMGNVIATTVTDNMGFYSFTDLVPGDYKIHILLGGQVVSPQGAGGDATKDSDIDMNGYSSLITLGSGENNLDIDAGFLPCAGCTDIVSDDTLHFPASMTDIPVCLGLAFTDAQLYEIAVNGLPYNNGLSACAKDTFVYYSFFGAGGGTSGPYNLDAWNVSGTTYSGAFADINALADSMNLWDPNGNWLVDNGVLKGGVWNPSIYGSMDVITTSTGQPTHIEPNYASFMTGTEMTIAGTPGISTVVFIDTSNTCCRDTVIIIVEGDNTLFAKNDINQTEVNVSVMGHVLTNDVDPEGNSMTVNPVLVTEPQHGSVVISPDGTYVYMPNTNYTGHDVFEYQVCDNGLPQVCDTARVDITIFDTKNPDNNPPVGVADHYLTFVGNPVAGSLLPNDSDPDGDNLTINTTPVSDPSNGSVVINPDGTYIYTPNAGFEGVDVFTYQICDDGTPVLCDTVTVTIDVMPNPGVNVTVATDDAGTGQINQPILGSLTANDTDPEGNTQTVNTTPVVNPMNGTVVINPDGSYTYTPDEDFVGNDQFVYAICDDGTPVACDTATVYLTIMAENTVVAKNDINQTLKNIEVSGSVVTNDEDPQGNAFSVDTDLVTQPANGTVTINDAGAYTYTPNTDFVGEDVFTYRICDTGTPQACDTADVYITVIGIDTTINNPPIGVVDNGTTLKDVPVIGQITTNDGDPDGDGIVIDTIPITPPSNGTVHINPDGSFVYVPKPGFIGLDTFFYVVCDDAVPPLCDTSMVIIEVLPSTPNNLVFANDDAGFGPMNTSIAGSLVLNDFDPQGDSFNATITPVSDPSNGTVVINTDGTYNYTPDQDYVGNDEFVYVICDDGVPVACDTATVYLTIFPAAPKEPVVVAVDDVDTTTVDTPVGIRILGNDVIPSDMYEINIITNPTNGTVIVDSLGFAIYTPNPGYCSSVPDEFQYEICNNSSCDTAIVQVYVMCTELNFVNGFSPNDDGINDFFVIQGVQDYPNNVLKIYNRWGNLVYSKDNYDNTWNGKWIQDSAPVPDGTYFYVWDNGAGKRYSGYIEIHR